MPEDIDRFEEIGELHQSVKRLCGQLLQKTKRLQAIQVLFWDDVHTKYEAVRDVGQGINMGVRKGEREGELLIVKLASPCEGTGECDG